ncbi:MAG TPA: universal stress protein [Solirubrobacterales bacterium]|nr:universal stress protein [Solirubrobacterales bacterium]
MIDTVIVGIEDTDEARDALRFARLFGAVEGARLHVVSVHRATVFYEGAAEIEAARAAYFDEMLQMAQAELGDQFEFHRLVEISPPAGLTEVAERIGADVVVIGSSHRGPIGRVLMGGAGSRLAAGSPCAVIVTPRGWSREGTTTLRRIGVAFNTSAEAAAALDFGLELQRGLGAELTLIGVVPEVIAAGRIGHTNRGFEEILREDMEELIGETLARIGSDGVGHQVREGHAADELAAASIDLDLLVLGSRGYGPLRRVLLGGTSVKVMRSSACPVVIVPRSVGRESA